MKMDQKKGVVLIVIGISLVVLIVLLVLMFTKDKDEKQEPDTLASLTLPTNTPTVTPEVITATPEPTPIEGMAKSRLTGCDIKEEYVNRRPYAVMLNNIEFASPQSGVSEAGVLYEALAEGGITRLLGIFDSFEEGSFAANRLGSVRSARHYFASFAYEYDAIFIHFGETTYATKKMKELKMDHIAGTSGIGEAAFYRDKNIKAPHNAFAMEANIKKVIDKMKLRTEHKEGYVSHFTFYPEETQLSSEENTKKITLGFSSYTSPYFIYNEESKLYERYQFEKSHVDANTGNILQFKNVIIQLVKEWDIDSNDYQTMDLEDTTGKGYYITNGKRISITWKKVERTGFMRYYDLTGAELSINPGKTFIAVFPENRVDKLIFEE